MKTDDLITALQADSAARATQLATVWKIAFVAALVAAALVFFAMLGPRPDMAEAMGTMRFPFKFVVTIALAASAAPILFLLAQPGQRWSAVALLAAPVIVALGACVELFTLPADAIKSAWIGTNSMLCMTFIPLIGLAPLGIFLAALRYAAPTRPALSGAVAGLLAGGIAATFYAAHCFDDSPLFVGTWYTLAVLGLAALGALAGRLLLRW
ncbi:MAG: NrsF family protein [Mesorhizobium sp.]